MFVSSQSAWIFLSNRFRDRSGSPVAAANTRGGPSFIAYSVAAAVYLRSNNREGRLMTGRVRSRWFVGVGLIGVLLAQAAPVFADDAPKIDTGDTAWMLTSSALVLMMTAPGLALFYG